LKTTTHNGDDPADVSVLRRAHPKVKGPAHEPLCRWAEIGAHSAEVTVQIRDLTRTERNHILELEHAYKGSKIIPTTERRIPARFRPGRPWQLLTTRGSHRLAVVGYQVYEGGEGVHFYVVLKSSARLVSSVGLVIPSGSGTPKTMVLSGDGS
jgi:hypothetical protein